MVKTVEDNSTYEPCIRSYKWLKLKRDYLEQSLTDSLDLCVVGAKYGEGKRTGFFGTFLLCSYNTEAERFETTGMCATGFSDEDLKFFQTKLTPQRYGPCFYSGEESNEYGSQTYIRRNRQKIFDT